MSIHAQPIFTTHLISSRAKACVETLLLPTVAFAACISGEERTVEHGAILSGSNTPLSRANCSRQMGRSVVNETTAKTSLFVYSDQALGYERSVSTNLVKAEAIQPLRCLFALLSSYSNGCLVEESKVPSDSFLEKSPTSSLVFISKSAKKLKIEKSWVEVIQDCLRTRVGA